MLYMFLFFQVRIKNNGARITIHINCFATSVHVWPGLGFGGCGWCACWGQAGLAGCILASQVGGACLANGGACFA